MSVNNERSRAMSDLEALLSDLPKLLEQARWAHGFGYSKAGRGLDAERGTDLSRTEAEREDGPKFDLQIGSHDARVAYQAAVKAVVHADVLLASIVDGLQPPLVSVHVFSRPDELEAAVKTLERRCGLVTVPDHRRVRRARQGIDRAVRGLSKALDAGPALGIAHNDPKRMCKNCKIQPRVLHEAKDGTVSDRRGGECEACSRYRSRNGSARPPRLWDDGIGQAKAAQARRIARNEGWGAA